MNALVIRADARTLPLPDASVDLIVTSPPYFALRDYGYAGQIGSEATPAEYIAALVACTREWVRVLKPSGSIFVNLGDKYQSTAPGTFNAPRDIVAAGGRDSEGGRARGTYRPDLGVRPKSLALLPERYRIACVDQLGLIARAVLVWSKPNGLPESVTDRVRRSHEDWVHLTKQPRYFAAVDEIREPHARLWDAAKANGRTGHGRGTGAMLARPDNPNGGMATTEPNPLEKLPGSVWTIPTEPLQVPERLAVDHFAAFPSEWPRRLILGWSPVGICTACDQGRRPVAMSATFAPKTWAADQQASGRSWHSGDPSTRSLGIPADERQRTITGYACACPEPTAPTRPSVVLDPFGGTGTTAHVAAALGRTGVSVDLSADYCRLAAAPELADSRLRKVLGLDRAEPVPAGQLGLAFGDAS